jgi:hypothetical protein
MSQQIYSLPPLAAWVPLLKMSRVFCGASPVVSMFVDVSLLASFARPWRGASRRIYRVEATPTFHALCPEIDEVGASRSFNYLTS